MIDRRVFLLAATACVAAFGLSHSRPGAAAEPIRIGDINSYSGLPAFTLPYRNGWQLALAEINDKGGVLGRPLEVISRDDGGNPGNALTAANELVARENVVLLMGTFFSHVGLAVSEFAKQKRVLFIAAEPLSDALTWEKGNRYTFRLRPSVSHAGRDAGRGGDEDAVEALGLDRAQLRVRQVRREPPSGRSCRKSDPTWNGWRSSGRRSIRSMPVPRCRRWRKHGPRQSSMSRSEPTSSQFVREGETRGLFQGREVVSLLTGEPEYLDPLKADAPTGWLVTGYPWYAVDTPEHKAFLEAYQAKFNEYPRLGSVVGYSTMQSGGGDHRQGRLDRYREDGDRSGGHHRRDALRPDHLSRRRPSVDDGRFRRTHRR